MIGMLRGKIFESSFTQCVIDVNGVGYEVLIALSTFDKLPLPGATDEVTLFIQTLVREDAITLYGFSTREEKSLFNLLLGVSGIGGKLALAILGAMPVSNFCSAIAHSDVKALSRISGIGKRTAERLVLELKEKLSTALGQSVFDAAKPEENGAIPAAAQAVNDTALALEQLGYKRDAIDRILKSIVSEVPEKEQTSEKLLRLAIIRLNF